MAVLFRPQDGPTQLNKVRINQSALGFNVPVIMGCFKTQIALLWLDGFDSSSISGQTNGTGGKGLGGGGKDGGEYDYSADVIAALCEGPITAIGDVWTGQSWLRNTQALETYVISGSSPSYTPINAATMTADRGVGISTAVSGTYNDLAAATPTTLSGTIITPLKLVAYGTTLSAGEYSVNPSTNQYNFSTANNGQTVSLSYSFALATVTKQENFVIPSSLQVSVGSSATGTNATPFSGDGGVTYYSSGLDQDTDVGDALTAVPYGTSLSTGEYSVNGTEPATYYFASGDMNKEVQATFQLNEGNTLLQGTPQSLDFLALNGAPGQTPWALLLSNYPGAALAYKGMAIVCFGPMDLGSGGEIQQITMEVLTPDAWGAGIVDCNPVQNIGQALTNPVWGLGAGPIPFPTSAIDNGTGGTWGVATPTGVAQAGSTASNWFAANSFFISPDMDKQDTAAAAMGRWLEAGMCAGFMSEGLFKLVPYGDTTTTGNGATWVAPSTFDAELDDTCFLVKGKNQETVKISSSPWTEAYNTVQISWSNRGNQYAPEITPQSDQSAINRYGSRIEDPQTWEFITTLPAANFAASMRVKRNVYTRNTYTFSLPFRFGNLEPMGIVSVTTNNAWSAAANNTIQLVKCPVRIQKIQDNPDGTYDVTCEDLITGAHTPDGFSQSVASPTASPNQYADPGNTTPVYLDAPLDLQTYNANELWIGAAGSNVNWGGCSILASSDGDTYDSIGIITGPSRVGVLNTAFPSHTDPDTTDSLIVNLTIDGGALNSGTETDADNATTLCYLDGELISYSACALSGPEQYTMGTYIRRGLMGTTPASHAIGAEFLRLDNTIFKYAYGPSWVGKTIYLKFQSFNSYGNAAQDASTLTAYTYTPAGINYPAPPIVTIAQTTSSTLNGNIVSSTGGLSAVATIYVTVTWTWPANYPVPSGFNVALFTGTDPTNTANYIAPIATVGASALSYTFAVSPGSTLSTVNAAVEALYA